MQRIIAAILVVALAVVCSRAQEERKEQKDDAYIVRGNTTGIPILTLLEMTSEFQKMVFMYNPRNITGSIDVLAPREGFPVERGKFTMFLQSALEQFRLALVKRGDLWFIVPQAEVVANAPIISEQDLPAVEPWQWVSVQLTLQNLDPNAATGALRNLSSRMGGMVQPIPQSTLVICDRADRAVQLVKLVRDMDAALRAETTHYPLPEGVNATEAAAALSQLFPETRVSACTFAASPNGNGVLARAPKDDQELIAQAVKALQE